MSERPKRAKCILCGEVTRWVSNGRPTLHEGCREKVADLEQRLEVSETEVARMTKLACDLLDGDYKEQAIKALLRTGSTGALTAASERARVATGLLENWRAAADDLALLEAIDKHAAKLAASPETPAAPGAQGFQGGPVNITQQASQETAEMMSHGNSETVQQCKGCEMTIDLDWASEHDGLCSVCERSLDEDSE